MARAKISGHSARPPRHYGTCARGIHSAAAGAEGHLLSSQRVRVCGVCLNDPLDASVCFQVGVYLDDLQRAHSRGAV